MLLEHALLMVIETKLINQFTLLKKPLDLVRNSEQSDLKKTASPF